MRSCNFCDLVTGSRPPDFEPSRYAERLRPPKEKNLARRPDAPTSRFHETGFRRLRARSTTVSRLHRWLGRKQGEFVDLGEYIHNVCAPFMSGLSVSIELTEDLQPGCLVRSDQILQLTQIASEAITNAIKYSHVKGETGKLLVRRRSAPDGQLEIDITDDGAGLQHLLDPSTSKGIGFRLIRAFPCRSGSPSNLRGQAPDLAPDALCPGRRRTPVNQRTHLSLCTQPFGTTFSRRAPGPSVSR